MTERALEHEIKVDVDPDWPLPALAGLVPGATGVAVADQILSATYVDTADHRLLRRGITLRHRAGEGPDGRARWTLKLPTLAAGAGLARHELSWPAAGGEPGDPPAEALALVAGLTRFAPLVPVARLTTRRRRYRAVAPGGRQLGELDDDTVTVHGGRRDGARFRQLEFEASDIDPATLDQVAANLRRAGAGSSAPKLALALDLDPASLARPAPALGPHSPVVDFVASLIAAPLERMLDHDVAVRLGDDDREPVHQLRVATRRCRSDLRTFGRLLDPVWVDHVTADLSWLADALGAVRDLDVLDQLVGDPDGVPHQDRPALAALRRRLGAERAAARGRLVAVMGDDRYLALIEKLASGSERPPLTARPGTRARRPVRRLVQRRLRRLRRRVTEAGPNPSDGDLHRIRIGAKQVRYAAEAATPVLGGRARRLARAAEDLQAVLGEHHDTVAAEDWLRRHAGSATSLAAGQLIERQRRVRARAAARWRRAWRATGRAGRRLG